MKIDENRLVSLPQTIGRLSKLEELIINSNDLEYLPESIGLLRSLHSLFADDNVLVELPAEIGSCIKLSILSLRDNKLVEIPAEVGHISNLKVINLSGNQLEYLPFSIAKLVNLQALWLSDNQNKPLIPLQSDFNHSTGQRVLTCFMLPQVSSDGEDAERRWSFELYEEHLKEERQQIKFAFDTHLDQPGKLVRAPTPYPKELRPHAKKYALKKHETKELIFKEPKSEMTEFENIGDSYSAMVLILQCDLHRS